MTKAQSLNIKIVLKKFFDTLCLCACVPLCLCAFVFISDGNFVYSSTISKKVDKKEDIGEKKRELHTLKEEIRQKKEKVKEVKKKEQKISQELQQTEVKLESTRKKLKEVSFRLMQVTKHAENITLQLNKEEEKFKKEQGEFAQRMRQVYEYGPLQFWEMLFGAENFFDFLNRVDFLHRILQYDVKLISQIKETKEKIKARQIELKLKCEEIEGIKKDVSYQEKEEKKQIDVKEKVLSDIQRERKAYEAAIRELEETSYEIEVWIKKMEAQRKQPSLYSWDHKWIRPVSGGITSGFGWRMHPVFKIVKFHNGIDIEAPEGTPIVAVANGEVIFSNWWDGYGKTVIIDHGSGVATLYAHCSQLLVGVGQHVKAGQRIALVGSTGISTAHHLHFEIRRNGIPINPLK